MGNLTNIIVVLTTINLLCVIFSSFLGVATLGDVVVNVVFGKNTMNTANPQINTQLDGSLIKQVSQQESGGFANNFFQLVDGLRKVFYVIINLLGLGFAIFTMLFMTGSPIILTMLVGLPIAIGYYLSIIGVIRGMDV